MKTIVFTNAASKQLDSLPIEAQEQIIAARDDYALSGAGDVRPLSGRPGVRMRVGRYRVIFAEDRISILAVYVGARQTTTYKLN